MEFFKKTETALHCISSSYYEYSSQIFLADLPLDFLSNEGNVFVIIFVNALLNSKRIYLSRVVDPLEGSTNQSHTILI